MLAAAFLRLRQQAFAEAVSRRHCIYRRPSFRRQMPIRRRDAQWRMSTAKIVLARGVSDKSVSAQSSRRGAV